MIILFMKKAKCFQFWYKWHMFFPLLPMVSINPKIPSCIMEWSSLYIFYQNLWRQSPFFRLDPVLLILFFRCVFSDSHALCPNHFERAFSLLATEKVDMYCCFIKIVAQWQVYLFVRVNSYVTNPILKTPSIPWL